MHWNEKPIFVIDFEGSAQSGIVEYGVICLHKGSVSRVNTRLCKATGDISIQEFYQHGIQEDDVAEEPPFMEEWELFSGIRQEGVFAAHHAVVENNFLKRVWPHGKPVPHPINSGKMINTWGPWVDTCELFKRIYPDLESHNLQALIGVFELQERLDELAKAHCPAKRRRYHAAPYDALASALLLMYLGELPEFENLTLEWLLIHSASSAEEQEKLEQHCLEL